MRDFSAFFIWYNHRAASRCVADTYCYIDLDEDEVDHFESHYGAFPDDFEDRIVVVVFKTQFVQKGV